MSHARSEYEDFKRIAPDAYDLVLALGQVAAKAGLDKQLLELVKLRASQINGCAFCVQHHACHPAAYPPPCADEKPSPLVRMRLRPRM